MRAHNCMSCGRLPKCRRVTAQMLVDLGSCALFEHSEPGTRAARERVLGELGPYSLLPTPNPRIHLNEEIIHMATNASRTALRKLAIASGILERSPASFDFSADELAEKLGERVPGVDQMSTEEVLELIPELTATEAVAEKPKARRGRKKAVAEKPKARRGRKKAVADEPPADEPPADEPPADEPPADEPKPAGRRRGRGATKPGRRRGRGATKPVESDAPAPDFAPILERIDAIGSAGDARDKAINGLAKDVASTQEQLSAVLNLLAGISAALLDIYNEPLEDEDRVDSVLDLLEDYEGN